MRDDGEQRARRPAWRALALFPVPDGLDGDAEARREFLLRQLRAAAEIAHFDRAGLACWHRRLQRELLPVPQLDNPSVRLQPQAHDFTPIRRPSCAKPVKVRLTI